MGKILESLVELKESSLNKVEGIDWDQFIFDFFDWKGVLNKIKYSIRFLNDSRDKVEVNLGDEEKFYNDLGKHIFRAYGIILSNDEIGKILKSVLDDNKLVLATESYGGSLKILKIQIYNKTIEC